ncbi:hypothetical protein FPQ18DRAFT_395238 [Pyronema domesticum]|nr:hypothetical protein FPQ18DRAFT_395238 [Pyronema domesticum]
MAPQEPSLLNSEVYTATDLSKRTDRTSYSIPDDGRPVTIQTRQARGNTRRRENNDSTSVISHNSRGTSLLIEYFESGKAGSGGRAPSVRVKVTPGSAAKKAKGGVNGDLEISEVGGEKGSKPTHTHRIQLSNNEDRLTLGQQGRSRSYSGDHSSVSSYMSGGDESLGDRAPFNVTVIRESDSPFSANEDYGRRRRRQNTRSRSVSMESDIIQEPGFKSKLGRRRSRSLSRERGDMSKQQKEKIQREVQDQLLQAQNPKVRKSRGNNNDTLKPPRQRSRSRQRGYDEVEAEKKAARKAYLLEGNQSSLSRSDSVVSKQDFTELVDGIRTLTSAVQQMGAVARAREQLGLRGGQGTNLKSLSMPDVGKPAVILSPNADKKNGMSLVLEGGQGGRYQDHLTQSPMHSEFGEGVSLVGAVPSQGEGRVRMPDIPFRSDTPGTNAETRASILSAKSGLPYPVNPAMPRSGTTPPPRSELPEFSELNMGASGINGASTLLTDRSGAAAGQSMLSRNGGLGIGAPSIASMQFETEVDHRGDDGVSAISSNTKGGATTVHPGLSELSFGEMSEAPTSIIAKERKDKDKGHTRRRSNANGKDIDELSDIREADSNTNSTPSRARAANQFFADEREREQQQALLRGNIHGNSLLVHHVSTETGGAIDSRRLEKVDTGQDVYDLGANPSMRSTPVIAHSAVASVVHLNPSNVGTPSALSPNRPSPLRSSPQPQLGANAMPLAHDPMPDYSHLTVHDDDDDINTNPSIIQGPGGHTSWEINSGGYGTVGDRGLNVNLNGDGRRDISPQPHSRLTSPQLGKDEGYISAANPMGSPGSQSPDGMRGMGNIDDLLSETEYYAGHTRNRLSSGNSHGMPSPLYESATGRGLDRIESKDIVALMEHLTVRDAQRNARDTEILVTLVRSAAEMRNSFEDIKKALIDQRAGIVSDVDQNTERSVQKVLQGPRPPPPSTPRRSRYSKSDEDADEETDKTRAKRAGFVRRALKGLSMGGSSKDLERIEDMLFKLLGEVEGLKDGQQFYQQNMAQSHSAGTIDALRSAQDPNEVAATINFVNSTPNGSYHGSAPPQHMMGKYEQYNSTAISPIQEDPALMTPPHEIQPIDSPKFAAAPINLDKSPPKTAKRESNGSIFPRISRWSETTASSGIKGFLGKGKTNQDGSEASRSQPDFNYWETEAARGAQNEYNHSPHDSEGQRTERAASPLVPPSSRDTDNPTQIANRISLDIQHPRPRQALSHQLEQQALQLTESGGGFLPGSPMNNSVSSLGNYPPLGPGGFQNGKLLSPLAQDAYAQHQAQMTPPKPPKIVDEDSHDGDSSTRRHKKHRERDENGERIRKPKRTEEEKAQRRKEKQEKADRRARGETSPSSKKKSSRDLMSDGDGPSIGGRNPSTASRLNGPRPLSSASNKENTRRASQRHPQNMNGGYGIERSYSIASWEGGDDH